jgi:dihydroorotate dehydrogenase electron transfer subunit
MNSISSAVSETDSIPQGAGKIRFLSVAASAHLRYTCSAVGLSNVVIGFNSSRDVILESDFRSLGVNLTVTTADGSAGIRGFVTDALPESYTYFYACGPDPMLKAVYRSTVTDGELSFEERMGCGFGACVGCTCKTKYGAKRICKDGPVLTKDEVIFDE